MKLLPLSFTKDAARAVKRICKEAFTKVQDSVLTELLDAEQGFPTNPRWAKKESCNLFLKTELIFKKMIPDNTGYMQVCEDQAFYVKKNVEQSYPKANR